MASGAGDNTPPNENIESSKVEESPAAVSEASSTVANDTNDDSEYETLDEDEEDSSPVVKPSKLRSKESDDEDGIDNVNDDDDEGDGNDDDDDEGTFDSRRLSNSSLEDDLSDDIIIEDERLGGDGQEKEEKKKLDDDMDRRNPQYIPRKSCYFEHDDRSSTSAVSTANSAEAGADSNNTVDRRRKVWSDRAIDDKWTHDKYVEEDQTAKSSQELIDTYGYDIRSEEAPPKARRRRKYGRGPSKYSRNWEDEEAYRGNLSSGDRRRSNNRIVSVENATEFPALADATQNKDRDQRKKPRPRNLDYKGEEHQISKPTKSILKTSNSKQNSEENRQRNNQRQNNENTDDGNAPAKDTSKEHVKFPPVGPVIVPSLPKNVRGRGQFKPGPGKMEFTPTRGRGRIPSGTRMNSGYSALPARPLTDNNQTPDPIMSVTSNMSSLQVTPIPVSSPQETKRPSIMEVQSSGVPSAQPGAVQEQSPSATNRSKRYSAQRQRSLPETSFSSPPPSGPPPTPPQVPPGVLAHDPNAIAAYYSGTAPNAPPPPHVPQATPEYSHPLPVPDYPPPNISAGMPTTVNTAMPPPPPPPPQMVAFLPAGPPPPVPPPAPTAPVPPFPPPSMINYVPAPTYPIPIRAPPVQQEVYQGQNGITYYSPQSQAAIPRQTPSRRKKVAIPIVPPPPDQQQQQQQQQGMVPMVMGVVGGVGTPPHIPAQQQMATVAPVVADSNTEA